jgi:hypothetical protein
MMATKGLNVEDYDAGTCTAAGCKGSSLFRVDRTDTGSAWQFNWEGARAGAALFWGGRGGSDTGSIWPQCHQTCSST